MTDKDKRTEIKIPKTVINKEWVKNMHPYALCMTLSPNKYLSTASGLGCGRLSVSPVFQLYRTFRKHPVVKED